MVRTSCFFIALTFFICFGSYAQVIITIAGTAGSPGYSGNGSPATAAKLHGPHTARPDAMGNVYIADNANNVVRKVDASGIISTYAGNGIFAHNGDGFPATDAALAGIAGLSIDNAGNVYIAEIGEFYIGGYIRKVGADGIITTVAGNSIVGFHGDGGPATDAGFYRITDIAVDRLGNLFIVDNKENRIRKVNTAGIISTVAGLGGSAAFSGDGGPATAANLFYPTAIAVDNYGNLFITDSGNFRIRQVDTTGIIFTICGDGFDGYAGDGGGALHAEISNSYGIAVDYAGNIYFTDFENYRIRKITEGSITTIAGTGVPGSYGDGGPAIDAALYGPRGIAVDSAGNIYIADMYAHNIRKINGSITENIQDDASHKGSLLQIWPEPNTGTFILSLSSPTTLPAHIIITNIIGQKIKELTTTTNKETAITLNAPPGIYFVTAITDQGKQSAKLILQ